MTRHRKKSQHKRDSNPGSSALEADALPLGQRGGPRGRDRRQRKVGAVERAIDLTMLTEISKSLARMCGLCWAV